MFFPFTTGMLHLTSDLSIIWEVEAAMAAVLKEVVESEKTVEIGTFAVDVSGLLEHRGKSAKRLAELRIELQFVTQRNADFLQRLMARASNSEERQILKSELNLSKDGILTACHGDKGFSEFLRQQTGSNYSSSGRTK